MSAHRFRFVGTRAADGLWRIGDEAELTHFRRVLHLDVGAEVEVFDGAGRAAVGIVAEAGNRAIVVKATTESVATRKMPQLVIAVGALKHGALDEILAPLVELGVDAVHVYLGAGVDKSRVAPKAVERWRRIAIQALKQCKRPYAPAVEAHDSLAAFLEASAFANAACLVLAPGAATSLLAATQAAVADAGKSALVCVVGGEAGLGDADLKLLMDKGFTLVSCGEGILRAVTAAVAAAAVLGAVAAR